MAHLNPPKKQQGIVLILALIMVVAVTGIAVTLMNSSSIDAKITAAVQEREVAENEVMGTVLKVIANQAAAGRNSAFFKKPEQIPEGGFDLGAIGDSTNKMINLNNGELDLPCPRKYNFTSGVSCNMVEVNTTITYGKKSIHTLTVKTGVAQEMASLNTGG
ncbi:pilus assembly PilX N-terminal domain-containing protein [Pseudoalteromonas sp. SYSU M81236]|uniref:pilus assembly PilX N-terminal domain-containing protein n=1 Tax=unclassified Pseudoalteromonas TaxID=194690 RepID=UPI001F40530E|nr:pilus assembly PilX N-terminal domain-containing protein [Pseudoalteromonas sp. OFAV1]MCF2899812.1 pilus assembly PilX N-terminal domain-containing protein [Pseudoalteromonas sp. OFAV1]